MGKQLAKWEKVAEWGSAPELRSAMIKAESAWSETGDVRVKEVRDTLIQSWLSWGRWG